MKITNMSVSSNDEYENKPAYFSANIGAECATAEEAFAFIDAARSLLMGKVDPVEAAVVRAAPTARASKPTAVKEPEPEELEEKVVTKTTKTKVKEPEPEPEEEDDDAVEVIAAGKPTVKITKELKNAQKLRDVLKILIDAGITSKKALVRECKALQAHVPVLERIEDLDGRVPKAAEIVNPDIED